MASRSSFMLNSYGGDSAAKPLRSCQTKVAQHVVKYGGGVQCMRVEGGVGGGSAPARCSLQHAAKSFIQKKGFHCVKPSDVLMYCVGGEVNLSNTVYNFPLSSNHEKR